jgi:pimeloyl-ACP methyl ester carboxylesterase
VTALIAAQADGTGQPAVETVHVDGIPLSARVLAVEMPRAVVVAVHGGAVTSAYFDSRQPPGASLLVTGAALGYTVIAIDRPGYGASAGAGHGDRMADPDYQVDLVYRLIDALLAGRPRGAGVFVLGHSMGCVLSIRLAADPRGGGLLGLEIAGTGLDPHPEAAFMRPIVYSAARPGGARQPAARGAARPPRELREALQEALWQPARLYPPGAAYALSYARAPEYEGPESFGWRENFPRLAARVRIPVHYTLGDHERVWSSGPAALAQVGALFTASPRVVSAEQAGAAHNLSRGWSALAYHLRVLSFAEECAVLRGHSADRDPGAETPGPRPGAETAGPRPGAKRDLD